SPSGSFLSAFFIPVLQPRIFQLDQNLSADTLLCADYELSAHPVNSFPHANQTKTIRFLLRIKTAPVVHKVKLNLICIDGQRRTEVPGVRVFDGIRQSFLSDMQQVLFIIS